METDFATEDLKNVFSKIMQFVDDDSSDIEEKPEIPSKSSKVSKQTLQKPGNITKTKDSSPSSEKPQNPSKRITSEEFQNTTYARMQAKLLNAEEKLRRQAKELESKVVKEIKSKPDINKSSKKITQKPIFERYEGILTEKKKKISEMQEKMQNDKKKEIEKELTFQPNVNKHSERSNVEFTGILDRMKEWEEKKNIRASLFKEEQDEKIKETHTFKPNLCENSIKLLEGQRETKDVALRLYGHKKPEVTGEVFSFAPSLNNKTQKLSRTRSEVKVFERLFEKNKESQDPSPEKGE